MFLTSATEAEDGGVTVIASPSLLRGGWIGHWETLRGNLGSSGIMSWCWAATVNVEAAQWRLHEEDI